MPNMTGTRDSYIEPSFPSGQLDPLRNYPIGHPSALVNYYKTKDVLLNGSARGVPTRSHNDVNFALQRDIAKGQGPIASVRKRPWDLVTADFVNVRDLSAPTATSGLYTTSVNDAGTLVPVGTHAEGSASPSILSYTTAAAHQSGIAVAGLFRVDQLDTDGVVGVFLLGTAATDHLRFEARVATTQGHVVTRDGGSDTSDADGDIEDQIVVGTTGETFISLGLRVNADDTYVAVVNGTVLLTGTISANAQAHTGNTVGVRTSGAAPGTGVLLFQAIDLKVL